jgi:hypothetical protein
MLNIKERSFKLNKLSKNWHKKIKETKLLQICYKYYLFDFFINTNQIIELRININDFIASQN